MDQPSFLHLDKHLHKVDALSCRSGERMVFLHPLKSKGCLHIHDRVRLILSLVRDGERMGRPSFSPPG